jgi:Dolichyl-phosphate-mannose-protein mannosyltransferase
MAIAIRPDPPRAAPEPVARTGRAGRLVSGVLVALVVLGAVLRLWRLGANQLGYDEAFTAMAGRLPLGSLFGFLRAQDSHPPLDYLLHAPLARLGVSALVFRMPSALCSIAALALFAWWMRDRGRAGLFATALMAVSAFQITHGRNARMYAELELLGVAIAILAESWLRAPRKRHAPILAALVLVGMLTHVSMFLVAIGLFALAGRRTDREAWRWRGAIVGAGAAWAVIWGPSFIAQSRGGHSDWIPRTTASGVVDTVSRLVTNDTVGALALFAAVIVGGVFLWRRERGVGSVWWAGFALPVALAALAGLFAPVLLDRTLTLTSWAPLLALGVLLDAVLRRSVVVGAVAVLALGLLMVPPTVTAITGTTGADRALRRLEAVARPGDVVAVRSAIKAPEIEWSLGVRSGQSWRPVSLPGITPVVSAMALGGGPPSGRVWLLDWNSLVREADDYTRCAPDQNFGRSRIMCLQHTGSSAIGNATSDSEQPAVDGHDDLALARHHTT